MLPLLTHSSDLSAKTVLWPQRRAPLPSSYDALLLSFIDATDAPKGTRSPRCPHFFWARQSQRAERHEVPHSGSTLYRLFFPHESQVDPYQLFYPVLSISSFHSNILVLPGSTLTFAPLLLSPTGVLGVLGRPSRRERPHLDFHRVRRSGRQLAFFQWRHWPWLRSGQLL